MKISYDPEVDAMYIELIETAEQLRTVQLSDGNALDFDKDKRLIGIEIINAKEKIGKGKIPTVIMNDITYEFA